MSRRQSQVSSHLGHLPEKRSWRSGGNLVLELIVYQQDHLAYLQLLVSVKSGKWSKINSSLSFQTPEWEGRAGGGGSGGEVSKIGPQRSSKNPRPRVLIAPELWKLHPTVHGPMGLLQGETGRKQEPRSQDSGNTLICKHQEAFLPLPGWPQVTLVS